MAQLHGGIPAPIVIAPIDDNDLICQKREQQSLNSLNCFQPHQRVKNLEPENVPNFNTGFQSGTREKSTARHADYTALGLGSNNLPSGQILYPSSSNVSNVQSMSFFSNENQLQTIGKGYQVSGLIGQNKYPPSISMPKIKNEFDTLNTQLRHSSSSQNNTRKHLPVYPYSPKNIVPKIENNVFGKGNHAQNRSTELKKHKTVKNVHPGYTSAPHQNTQNSQKHLLPVGKESVPSGTIATNNYFSDELSIKREPNVFNNHSITNNSHGNSLQDCNKKPSNFSCSKTSYVHSGYGNVPPAMSHPNGSYLNSLNGQTQHPYPGSYNVSGFDVPSSQKESSFENVSRGITNQYTGAAAAANYNYPSTTVKQNGLGSSSMFNSFASYNVQSHSAVISTNKEFNVPVGYSTSNNVPDFPHGYSKDTIFNPLKTPLNYSGGERNSDFGFHLGFLNKEGNNAVYQPSEFSYAAHQNISPATSKRPINNGANSSYEFPVTSTNTTPNHQTEFLPSSNYNVPNCQVRFPIPNGVNTQNLPFQNFNPLTSIQPRYTHAENNNFQNVQKEASMTNDNRLTNEFQFEARPNVTNALSIYSASNQGQPTGNFPFVPQFNPNVRPVNPNMNLQKQHFCAPPLSFGQPTVPKPINNQSGMPSLDFQGILDMGVKNGVPEFQQPNGCLQEPSPLYCPPQLVPSQLNKLPMPDLHLFIHQSQSTLAFSQNHNDITNFKTSLLHDTSERQQNNCAPPGLLHIKEKSVSLKFNKKFNSEAAKVLEQIGNQNMNIQNSMNNNVIAHSQSNLITENIGRKEFNKAMQRNNIKKEGSNVGIFWTDLDNLKIPCMDRQGEKFVSLRIIEQLLLNNYPTEYKSYMRKTQTLHKTCITDPEAENLDSLNNMCNFKFGKESFKSDELVLLSEFMTHYTAIKQSICGNNSTVKSNAITYPMRQDTNMPGLCGWKQINNSVIPYIVRQTHQFVPLCILKEAVCVSMLNPKIQSFELKVPEINLLNEMCKRSGFSFKFDQSMSFVRLLDVKAELESSNSVIFIKDLPLLNPLNAVTTPGANLQSKTKYAVYDKGTSKNSEAPKQPKTKCALNPKSTDKSSKSKTEDSVNNKSTGNSSKLTNVNTVNLKMTITKPKKVKTDLNSSSVIVKKKLKSKILKHKNTVKKSESKSNLKDENSNAIKDVWNPEAITGSYDDAETCSYDQSEFEDLINSKQKKNSSTDPQIRQMDINKKKLTVITKEDGYSYVLAQILAMVFFRRINPQDVIDEILLHKDIHCLNLSPAEENAFIQFYQFPVTSLSSTLLVRFEDFIKNMASIEVSLRNSKKTRKKVMARKRKAITVHLIRKNGKIYTKKRKGVTKKLKFYRKMREMYKLDKHVKVCLVDIIKNGEYKDICKNHNVQFNCNAYIL